MSSVPSENENTPYIPELEHMDREALREAAVAHGIDLVVLFGSTARGSRRRDSDLDVAYRFAGPRPIPPTLEEEAGAEGALFEALQARCEVDFVRLNRASPLLQWNVARHGIPLFCISTTAWLLFRIRSNRDYEDSARFRERQWRVLLRRLGRASTE